ncbi:MAG: hypothetical protein ACE5GZ_07995 [Gammaproteobacteria bacterium]
MHRTQLLLEEWQYEALRARAARDGRSLSALIREILSTSLGPPSSSPRSRLEAIEGIGEDTEAYGEQHDRYLYGETKDR